jgi:hypothetical protein
VVAPPPEPDESPPLSEPPSFRPRRSRRLLYAGIVAVLVAVIVVVAVVLPSSGPGAPTVPGGAITYGQGAAGANYSVRSFNGTTGWSLLFAAGLEAPVAEPAAVAVADLGVSNCSLYPVHGGSASISLPAFAGSPTSGRAPLWEFFYQNVSTEQIAVVVVENGGATLLGTLASPECTDVFAIITPIPAHVLDSPTIGAAVAANASSFLAAHPNVSAVYGLIGPVFGALLPGSLNSPKWVVEFTTCALTPDPSGSGAEYNASVNANSGAEFYSRTVPSESCASNPPAAIGLAPWQGLVSATERSATARPAR